MFNMALRHMALFWLNAPNSLEDRTMLAEGLESLRAIPQVKSLHIGQPASTEDRDVVDHSWDLSESMTFDSLADQSAYQMHPAHKDFIDKCGHLWERVLVYDIVDYV
jgi:Stress responsive A/B Barrel Domain